MKCQNRFPMENKKNIINLSSPELAQRVVKVFLYGNLIHMHLDFFSESQLYAYMLFAMYIY